MSRLHIGKFDGTDVWEGPCEGCGVSTRIVWDESVRRYLCAKCLEAKDTPTVGHAFAKDPEQPYPIGVNGHSKRANLNPKDTFLSKYFRFDAERKQTCLILQINKL